MFQHRPEHEFYDLESDPYELSNLADDPAHAKRMASMRDDLLAWMAEQGDEGIQTELKAEGHFRKPRSNVPPIPDYLH